MRRPMTPGRAFLIEQRLVEANEAAAKPPYPWFSRAEAGRYIEDLLEALRIATKALHTIYTEAEYSPEDAGGTAFDALREIEGFEGD